VSGPLPNLGESYNPPLRVEGLIATRSGEEDRGPLVLIRADEARRRLIEDGELVWLRGPRGQQLAPVRYDDSVPKGGVVVRDMVRVAPSEVIRLVKVDLDRTRPPGLA
jgi:anaerobic selenocysteine-containing dehydrogenase